MGKLVHFVFEGPKKSFRMCNQVMASSFGKSTTARKFLKTILRVQNSVKESEHIVYNTSIPFKGQKAILEERNNI